mgnify:CR=1 FL=1
MSSIQLFKIVYEGRSLRYQRLWIVYVLCIVHAKAEFITIDSQVGEERSCVKQISSLLQDAYGHYPSIEVSKKMIMDADAQSQSAKWNYFPTPSVEISQRAGRRGTTLRLDQPLWTGGKLDAISDLASAREDEAEYTLGETSYALAQKVLSVLQYYIQADGEIKGFSEGKQQLESLAKMLERRIEAGVSSESDRELLHARIAQIDADLMLAQSKYDMALSQLELLTGNSEPCAISFAKDRIVRYKISLKKMEEELLQTHPALKKLTAKIAMANAEKKGADAVMMPNISLRAEHQKGTIYDTEVQDDTVAYVAVSFSPGAGLSAISNIESAKYRVFQAQDELKVKEQELKESLVVDYADFIAATARTESIRQTIEASQRVLESYTRLFIAGKRQWLDLVNTSREVTQNKIALATLKAVWITSAYRLALQTGKIEFGNEGK